MNTSFKKNLFRHKKIIISVILIISVIGLTFLIMNVFAETPSDCIGTDVSRQDCCTCLAITASPSTIPPGGSSTLTLYVDNNPNSPSDICSPNGFSSGDGTAVCSIDNGVLSNTIFNDGTYDSFVSPANTTTYTATCSGIGGTKTSNVKVTITVVDTTPPTISFNPISRPWDKTNANVIVTASDASGISATYYCWTTGVSCAPGTSFANGSTLTQSSNGNWNLCIKARDNFNNETTQCSGRYQIDKTLPIVDSFSVDGNVSNFSTSDTSLTIAWSVSDGGGSGLLRVEVWRQTDGGGWSKIHEEPISANPDSGYWVDSVICGHSYEYGIHVVDNANNMGQEISSITATVQCNQKPNATNLTVVPSDYCTYSLPTKFSWNFSDPDVGDVQEYYQVQIDNNFDFSSIYIDSGKIHSSSGSYVASGFLYNTPYYWKVKVWDNIGADSGWIPGPSFTTPSHKYPAPEFTWSPSSPSANEIVQLCAVQTGVCPIDQSICYNSSNNPISCSGKTFLWTLPTGAEFASTSVASTKNPQIKFTDSGNYTVTLKITDNVIGGSCTKTHQIQATLPLPEWEETTP